MLVPVVIISSEHGCRFPNPLPSSAAFHFFWQVTPVLSHNQVCRPKFAPVASISVYCLWSWSCSCGETACRPGSASSSCGRSFCFCGSCRGPCADRGDRRFCDEAIVTDEVTATDEPNATDGGASFSSSSPFHAKTRMSDGSHRPTPRWLPQPRAPG